MKWFKIGKNVWISERESYDETSRIKEHDGVYYARGENYNQIVYKEFNSLKEAKQWIKTATGYKGNP